MAKFNLSTLRDKIWDYPSKIVSFYSKSKPIPEIISFIVLAIVIYKVISAPFLFSYIKDEKKETFSEGVVGQIETLNPMFISGSNTDRAIHSLIYTKFVEISKDGEPLPAIVKEWQVSDGGKKIYFILNDNYYWHDGKKLTSDDVIFTFEESIKMAKAGYDTNGSSFLGLTITADSDYSVIFNFEETIQNIFEVLSIYIVPKHIHTEIDATKAYLYGKDGEVVGSGKYYVSELKEKSLKLSDFDKDIYSPPVKEVTFNFFQNLDQLKIALKNGYVDCVGGVYSSDLSDILAEYKNYKLYSIHINLRKKLLYLNLRDEVLKNPQIRQALSMSIDKEELVNTFDFAYIRSDTTISSKSWAYNEKAIYYNYNKDEALKNFKSAGYTIPEGGKYLVNKDGNRLTLEITYIESINNKMVVDEIQKMLEEVGVEVQQKSVTYTSMVNEILATRSFDILLMELEINRDPDQYNLWHSTKVNYPDLNLSGYSNNRVDIMLERARKETNKNERKEDYLLIQKFIAQDVPAIVLFEPAYVLMLDDSFKNVRLEDISFPYQRYKNIENWEIE